MEDWICVSSFYYESAFRIRKYMKVSKIPYKMDCTAHPDDGFQLLIPQNHIDCIEKIRSDLKLLTSLSKSALLSIHSFS